MRSSSSTPRPRPLATPFHALTQFVLPSVCGVFVSSFALGCEGSSYVQLSGPLLLVSTDSVDFGAVPVGSMVEKRLTLANGGRQSLRISRIEISGNTSFAVEHPPATTIAPESERELTIRFMPIDAIASSGTLTIESTAENARSKTVVLLGRGTNEKTIEPDGGLASADGGIEREDGGDPHDANDHGDSSPGSDSGVDDADSGEEAPENPCPIGGQDTDPGLGAPLALFARPGEHVFRVPSGVTNLSVRVWGGGGQGGNQEGATGGGAGFVSATIPVTPGEALDVWVAQGGAGQGTLGHGGGASYIRRETRALLVAAGGGGGGSDGNSGGSISGGRGGAGGRVGEDGQDGMGTIAQYCTRVTGGAGATALGGGTGGTYEGTGPVACNGQPGGFGYGGRSTGTWMPCDTTAGAEAWRAGGGQANGGGGGGGSGHFGGGGAGFIYTYCAGGGGGGSSYADSSATDVRFEDGSGPFQGLRGESFGAGRGGERCTFVYAPDIFPACRCNAGGDGRVEIRSL